MVNYLYDLDDIEKNHEAYAEGRTVVASNAVQRLLRPPLGTGADRGLSVFYPLVARESGDPVLVRILRFRLWIPACAGMNGIRTSRTPAPSRRA